MLAFVHEQWIPLGSFNMWEEEVLFLTYKKLFTNGMCKIQYSDANSLSTTCMLKKRVNALLISAVTKVPNQLVHTGPEKWTPKERVQVPSPITRKINCGVIYLGQCMFISISWNTGAKWTTSINGMATNPQNQIYGFWLIIFLFIFHHYLF